MRTLRELYVDFYNHSTYFKTHVWDSWWSYSEEGRYQRVLFIKHLKNEL